MDRRESAGGAAPKVLFAAALVTVVVGPAYAMLAGALGVGILIFSAGVVLPGVGTLVGGRDRAAAWVLILIGSLTAAADALRLLLAGPW